MPCQLEITIICLRDKLKAQRQVIIIIDSSSHIKLSIALASGTQQSPSTLEQEKSLDCYILFWFGFWPCTTAYGILIPRPRSEPGLSAVKWQSPTLDHQETPKKNPLIV